MILCICLSAPAYADEAPLGADVAELLAHARLQSAELASMRQEAQAAAQRVDPAGALPDPVARVEFMNLNNYGGESRVSVFPPRLGETRYTLMQSLPAPGKRELRRDVAAADLAQADARLASTWTELAARIKAAYAEYYRASRNSRLASEVLELMARLEQMAQARYAAGLAPQQDAIRAQLEQTAMRAELIALEGEKRQWQARLNALLARPADAALAEPVALRPVPALASADATALAERARNGNPQLKAELARVQGAQKNRDLTQRNRWPDLVIGISPTQVGSRITTWGVMLEANIPLRQDTRRDQEREAEAMVQAAQSRAEALSQQLLGELGANLAGLDSARRSEVLVQTQLMPQSALGLQSALVAYENGKSDFAMVLDAQRQTRKARQEELKYQVEAQMRLAEIERIVGEEL